LSRVNTLPSFLPTFPADELHLNRRGCNVFGCDVSDVLPMVVRSLGGSVISPSFFWSGGPVGDTQKPPRLSSRDGSVIRKKRPVLERLKFQGSI
jgi:hypothetical protein